MDGAHAVRAALLGDAALLALVPANAIVIGDIPLRIGPPAIGIGLPSSSDLNLIKPAAMRFVTERTRATVVAATYESLVAILKALRHAAADRLDVVVVGISGVTIHTAGQGPMIQNPDSGVCQRSQDFMVRYTETR